MRILVQWSTSSPGDWTEIESSDWAQVAAKSVPVGGESIDGAAGWVHALNVQGVIFTGYDHLAVEDIADGCRVFAWNDDPDDWPGDLARGAVWTFPELAADAALGGAINTRQQIVKYPGATIPLPDAALWRHGIWTPDALHEAHEGARAPHGWREWGSDGPVPDQRALGRFIQPDGTRTYFGRDIARPTGTHATIDVGSELAYEMGPGTPGNVVSGILGGDSDGFLFVFTTPAGEPDSAAWAAGNYRVQLDVFDVGADISFGLRTAGASVGHFGRVDSGLTSDLETHPQTAVLFMGPGLKLAETGSVSWTAGASGDRFEALVAGSRPVGHGNQSLTLELNETDDFADGPWPAPVSGTLLAAVLGANV